ncbi:phosphatase PAP2 family protein [Streptomyces sp. RerS4]|uniref:phosphatase PAP2 family protein n=1 Tax=Streptomyces sp. RerS4 TaxID=2942449 RepID=UPI00201CA9C3|nr:phosphatase PAP2 family protein [Streptomyces sp. RerS4]UQX03465.1 phosphatase PAP2 family protein [Streptomyces sp. RerS4]
MTPPATSTPPDTDTAPEPRFARLVTDGLEPRNWIIAVTLLMGWHADRLAGVGWGLVSAFFCGVVPILFIKWGERRGHWGDRHVRRRQDRLLVIPGIMLSVAACIALMKVFDAPQEMIALIAAMLAALVVILAVTTVWKVSVHTAVSSGALVMLAFAYGPWALAAYPLVALVGWSRVALRDHTLAQVLVGTALGAATAAPVFTLLR